MNWLEISVTVESEIAEAVAGVLSGYVPHGVAIEAGPDGWNTGPVIVRAYLPSDDDLSANCRRVEEALWHLGQVQPIPAPNFRTVAEEDWAEAWKERLTVMHFGQRLVVRPSWLEYAPAPGEVIIQLDPGMAFGTGLHSTTQMCLVALEEAVRPRMEVLDLGTGSGILAIAAAKLGAGYVLAVDNDPVAVRAARENVVANGVQETVSVMHGSLAEAAGSYDLVAANILARVIVAMAQEGLAKRVRSGGTLVATGILDGQEPEVIAALEREGLSVIEQRRIEDWVCLLAQRVL
jgi:ribosomal protein L11 methyltransferase